MRFSPSKRRKLKRAEEVLDEEVVEAPDLVTGTKREVVASADVREVVGDLDQVLVEAVGLTEPVRTKRHNPIGVRLNLHLGEGFVADVTLIPNPCVHDSRLVEHVVADRRVELSDRRVLFTYELVLPAAKSKLSSPRPMPESSRPRT